MPSYRYQALAANQQTEQGHVDADSLKQARNVLRARGLTVLSVEPLGASATGTSGGQRAATLFGPRLSAHQRTLAVRQLASLLTAGLPLERALAVLVEQAESAILAERLAAVRSEVLAGHSLAEALGRYPRDFPALMCALVAAGEASGQLAGVLERLADYLEARGALTQKVVMAFTYPAIVTVVSLLVVLALMTYVVPQIVQVFTSTKQTLPWLTVALIAVSDFLRHYGWMIGLMIVAAAITARQLLQRPALRLRWHHWLLRAPVLGKLLNASNTAHFASTLAILVGSGVPLLRALQAGGETLSNRWLQERVAQAAQRVREGSSLARALGEHKAFPPVLVHMIGSGEATGQLPAMLDRAAAGQRQEVERRAVLLTQLLEPVLILGMGLIVLIIVLAVLLPIIEINQMIR
ncbi:type II secretion system inner membrane protein GspF [Parvibium lacunae]|uniref:Type II secretion system protein GspF n=1 Tax=Parvibium lacunae TaxID=1888893 RepID=A0A368KZS2_9BURK|nr:type II secretion system inner membrane protein GspF [Parvibium lacunae]RCS56807.1 type II secretion system protein GspF [Parvibium lacunae]